MNLCNCDAKVPISQYGYGKELPAPGPGVQLAIVTVPIQPREAPYEPSKTPKQGTIFPCLDLSFFIAGDERNA